MAKPAPEREPLPNVFGLRTAPNLFRKLLWEREQLHRALAPEIYRYPDVGPIYVAFNCAVTAWHLVDWVWADATDTQRATLASTYGLCQFKGRKGRKGFSEALCERVPELAACHDIANGSKHFQLTQPKSSVKVEADFAVVVDPAMSGLNCGEYLLTLHVWLPDRKQNMTAKVFFDKILAFWYATMNRIGMLESARELIELIQVPTLPPWMT